LIRPPYVATSAIAELLARPCKDSDKAKAFDESALDTKLAALVPVPDFVTSPRLHQKVGFLLGAAYSGYLFFFDMGLGKSWLMLNLHKWRRARGDATKAMLVLAPLESIVIGWEEQVTAHSPCLTYAGVAGGADRRAEAKRFEADVTVMTYASFLRLVSVEVPLVDDEGTHKKTRGGKSRMKWVVDSAKVAEVMEPFSTLVIDESTSIRNTTAQTYKAVRTACRCVDFKYCLAGRPFGRDPADLWPQFKVVDDGESMGETITLHRAAFFTAKKSYWSGGFDYKFDTTKEVAFRRRTRHRSITYSESECKDLPPKIYVVRKIKWAPENREFHERLLDEMKQSGGAFRVVDNVFLRMRQLSSGYLGVVGVPSDDTTDSPIERITIKFKDNPKLDELMAVLDGVPLDRKAIVFHDYTITGQMICDRLKADKYKHVWLHGGTSNKPAVLDKFKKDPKCRVFVCNSAAGAMGLNLQVANYCIFYESPVSPIIRAQAEKRAHRDGQTEAVFIIDLLVCGSVDEKIIKYIREGNDLFAAVLTKPSTLWL